MCALGDDLSSTDLALRLPNYCQILRDLEQCGVSNPNERIKSMLARMRVHLSPPTQQAALQMACPERTALLFSSSLGAEDATLLQKALGELPCHFHSHCHRHRNCHLSKLPEPKPLPNSWFCSS